MLKIVDQSLLINVSAQAATSPRLRKNFNLHTELSDLVQRFLNAVEPGSYVRPHRHVSPNPKWELFVVLSGSIAVLVFDDDAMVTERVVLDSEGPNIAIEIPAGCWHSLVALKSGTVLFELKQGPYAAVDDKDFASWAPNDGGPDAAAFEARFRRAEVGDQFGNAA